MTAHELVNYALAANCKVILDNHKFIFTCPEPGSCLPCGMWNIPNLTSKCLFWDEELVPESLQLEATSILQSTHPELFL